MKKKNNKKSINNYNEQVSAFESLIKEEAIRVEELMFGIRNHPDNEKLLFCIPDIKNNKKKKK